jgi:1,4-alpha-glucan branching enzyme
VLEPLNKKVGDPLTIAAKTSQGAVIKFFLNGVVVGTSPANYTEYSVTPTITTAGTQTVIAEATNGSGVKRDTLTLFASSPTNVAPLPAGLKDGINYEPGDTSLTLVLYAPSKSTIFLIGDFNNWSETAKHQMNVTPDGTRFWLRLTGLTPGVEYAYQYLIDGSIKVADYNTEKVLDPANDQFIPAANYPNLKPYPAGKTTGIVSVLQTAKPSYNWQVQNFARPDKRNLIIYELLVRDFIAAQNWQTLKDTLSYLKKLGVNAIELMPFNEFEGNNSWGYNTSFFFAPDKMYGTENALRQFIDECHKQGMAVIMDIVFNHAYGQSPTVQMYYNSALGRPAANNPWHNEVAKHAFNVGFDFNHESQATKDLVDRVMEHWLTKYKIDGFRWDLSKGFTQKQTCDNNGGNCNEGAMAAYDASRIAILSRINDKMQSISQNSYSILEHFADNTEEKELSAKGMLLWGNLNYNFGEAAMGYVPNSNFEWGIHKRRDWAQPHLITYMESHDEERLIYKNLNFGNSSNPSHNTRDLNTALKRNEMAASFWAMIPAPKMLWQFQELGYDYSINHCENGTINNNCRTNPKPIRWDYLSNPNRKALYDVYAKLLKLRNTPNFLPTWVTDNVTYSLAGGFKTLQVSSDSLKVTVIGNFDVTTTTGSVTFQNSGTWYNYLNGGTKTASGTLENITLQPGEYYVYTSRDVNNLIATPIRNAGNVITNMKVSIFPNPVSSHATVEYDLPESGTVEISIFNNVGQQISSLFRGFKSKGTQRLSLNSSAFSTGKLATGTYLLKINLNGKTKLQQFVVQH